MTQTSVPGENDTDIGRLPGENDTDVGTMRKRHRHRYQGKMTQTSGPGEMTQTSGPGEMTQTAGLGRKTDTHSGTREKVYSQRVCGK